MAKSSSGSKEEEPSIAPQPERWYNLRLGHSFRDHHPSSKFCTLRYEFKPASVDKNQPGSLHKKKDNRVTVEFQNNQHGKPKVIFEGVSEDYKENDAVLFFDGETFHLERLHRAVKRLRHVRIPGESATPAGLPFVTSSGPAVESHSPPLGKVGSLQVLSKAANQQQVEVEKIGIGSSDNFGTKCEAENTVEQQPLIGSTSTSLPDVANYELEEHIDIVNENDYGLETATIDHLSRREIHSSIDINVPQQNEGDDEIADVDVSDDDVNPGYNAAEALRAQVAVEREEQSSSSSSSSGSDTSDSGSESGSGSGSRSGSGSSSSDSESSEGDSVTSI